MKKLFGFILILFTIANCVLKAQWVQSNGPYGAYAHTMVASGSNLLLGINGGMYLSTNNGTNWTSVNNEISGQGILSLVNTDNYLFAATYSHGIYYSSNNGINWNSCNFGLTTNSNINTLAASGTDLYAGTFEGGIFYSSNSGRNWTQVNNGLTKLNVEQIVISNENVIAMVNYEELFLSTNKGANWTPITTLPNFEVTCVSASGSDIFAGGTGNEGIIHSTNNGTTWTFVNNGLAFGTVNSIAIFGSNIYAVKTDGVYVSSNNGANWNIINTGLTPSTITSVYQFGNLLFGLSNGPSIYRGSNNGSPWSTANNGLININVPSITASSNGNLFAATDGAGVFLSTDNGTSWNPINNGLTYPNVEAIAIYGNNLFAGNGGGVYISTNNGNNWIQINGGLTNFDIFTFAVSDSNLYVGTYGGVFKFNDDYKNWTLINNDLTSTSIRSLAVTPSGINFNKSIFAGTMNGLFVSTNNGTNWKIVNGVPSVWIYSLVFSGTNLFAGTDSGMYLSTNNGITWTLVNNSIEPYATTRSIAALSNKILFSGGTNNSNTIYFSSNSGTNWKVINTGLPSNTQILKLVVSGNNLFAGTTSSVWKRPLSDFGIYTITAQIDPTGAGTVQGNGIYMTGDQAILSSIPLSGSKFLGWYENGNKISNETSYSFIVSSNRTLIAKYLLLPTTPVVDVASNIKQTSFNANWKAVELASGYFLDVAIDNQFVNFLSSFKKLDVGNKLTYLIDSLPANATFYYRVYSYNDAGICLKPSDIITVKTLPALPNSPAAQTATEIKSTSFKANWSAVTGATGYFLDVATDDQFTNKLSQFNKLDVSNSLTYSVDNLTSLRTYYYRVYSYNTGGTSLTPSNMIAVTTLILSPIAQMATEIKATSFKANWLTVTGATGYYLDIATDDKFIDTLPKFNKFDTGNSLTCVVENLTPQKTYYYRVYSYSSNGKNLTPSNTITVTTLPLAPNSPVAQIASEIKATSFKANWSAVTGATGYYIYVATDNQFIDTLPKFNKFDAGNSMTCLVANLTPLKTYYYRVYSYNTGGISQTPSNIIIVTTLPLAPNSTVAQAATDIKQTSFKANWTAVTGATGYYLDVAIDDQFIHTLSTFNKIDAGNSLNVVAANLSPETTYYYRVYSYNAGGNSLTPSNTITVITLPLAPDSPVAQIASDIKQTSFKANWSNVTGATGYYLDIATDDQFADTLHRFNEFDAGNTLTCLVENLTPASKYYYRVYSYNTGGKSLIPSNTITVTTLPLAPNSPVAQAATNQKETSFTANWMAVTGATGYYLDIAIDEGLKNLLIDYNKKDVGNVTSFQISGLPTKTDYYYDVIAYNTGGESNISNSIKVSLISGIERLNPIPTVFELNQNYPNPFNPTTKINYAIPKPGFVKINIYNVLGTLVKSLVNENQITGYYSIELNAGSLGSGIYFYRMESGSFSQTKKLLLVK